MRSLRYGLFLCCLFSCLPALASEGLANGADLLSAYQRAFQLPGKWRQAVKGLSFEPVWIDSSRFWFRSEEDEGFRYVLIDVRAATRTPVFDHVRLAAQLAEQIGQVVDEGAFNFPHFSLAPDLSTMDFIFADRLWHYDLASGVLNLRGPAVATPGYWGNEEEERGRIEVPSLDGRKVAWVEGWNLKLLDAASGQITTLSQDGSAEHYYSNRLIWSPDSQHIAAARITLPAERSLLLLESTPREGGLPRLQTRHYPCAGDPVIQREPRIFGIDGKVLEADPALFPDPYRLDGFRWNRRGDVLSFDYADRAYQLYRVLGMSASDGRVWSQVEERSDTYINLPRIYRFDLADDRHMLWASERDGYNHLYLYERVSGRKIRQITHGLWYVRDVLRVDELRREIVFSANGVNPAEDPYLIRYHRIGFDGKDMRDITPAPGMHSAWLSPDGRYLLDRWSTLSLPPQTAVRDALTGEVLMPVERVDDRTLKTLGWSAPEPFVAKGRDGVTDIWGVIIRPSDFDPSRVYPVIECIYASPGGQFVPKRFMPDHWPMTAMAELGFIVVQIDGMGTSFRSRSFENVIWKNLADSGLSDRIAWIKAAAQTRPWMDISRVGIFGASAGGHSAMAAVLHHPEFYKAAFAAAGSHDNRLDKRWWNEQWMGYPVGPGYAASSNVDNAWRLTRPLMLLVGELDDNVDPASTLRVADALIRAKKDFELVFMPGVGHTLGGSYGDHKRYDFFVRTLMGRSPPNWQLLEDQGRPSP